MDHIVKVVHMRLDDFEVQVLEKPSTTNDMSAIQIEVANLWADIDTNLYTHVVVPQYEPSSFHYDTVMGVILMMMMWRKE